jgi:6-phosphogluconate dehydrogenase
MTIKNADIGLVGLAVMGQNLALNIADHGYTIAVYNRAKRTSLPTSVWWVMLIWPLLY